MKNMLFLLLLPAFISVTAAESNYYLFPYLYIKVDSKSWMDKSLYGMENSYTDDSETAVNATATASETVNIALSSARNGAFVSNSVEVSAQREMKRPDINVPNWLNMAAGKEFVYIKDSTYLSLAFNRKCYSYNLNKDSVFKLYRFHLENAVNIKNYRYKDFYITKYFERDYGSFPAATFIINASTTIHNYSYSITISCDSLKGNIAERELTSILDNSEFVTPDQMDKKFGLPAGKSVIQQINNSYKKNFLEAFTEQYQLNNQARPFHEQYQGRLLAKSILEIKNKLECQGTIKAEKNASANESKIEDMIARIDNSINSREDFILKLDSLGKLIDGSEYEDLVRKSSCTVNNLEGQKDRIDSIPYTEVLKYIGQNLPALIDSMVELDSRRQVIQANMIENYDKLFSEDPDEMKDILDDNREVMLLNIELPYISSNYYNAPLMNRTFSGLLEYENDLLLKPANWEEFIDKIKVDKAKNEKGIMINYILLSPTGVEENDQLFQDLYQQKLLYKLYGNKYEIGSFTNSGESSENNYLANLFNPRPDATQEEDIKVQTQSIFSTITHLGFNTDSILLTTFDVKAYRISNIRNSFFIDTTGNMRLSSINLPKNNGSDFIELITPNGSFYISPKNHSTDTWKKIKEQPVSSKYFVAFNNCTYVQEGCGEDAVYSINIDADEIKVDTNSDPRLISVSKYSKDAKKQLYDHIMLQDSLTNMFVNMQDADLISRKFNTYLEYKNYSLHLDTLYTTHTEDGDALISKYRLKSGLYSGYFSKILKNTKPANRIYNSSVLYEDLNGDGNMEIITMAVSDGDLVSKEIYTLQNKKFIPYINPKAEIQLKNTKVFKEFAERSKKQIDPILLQSVYTDYRY